MELIVVIRCDRFDFGGGDEVPYGEADVLVPDIRRGKLVGNGQNDQLAFALTKPRVLADRRTVLAAGVEQWVVIGEHLKNMHWLAGPNRLRFDLVPVGCRQVFGPDVWGTSHRVHGLTGECIKTSGTSLHGAPHLEAIEAADR